MKGDAFLANFRADLGTWGFARTLQKASLRLARRLIGLHVLRVEKVDLQIDYGGYLPPPEYHARVIPIEDLESWIGKIPGLEPAWYAQALSNRDGCIANFYRGEIVGYSFLATRCARLTEQLEIRLGGDLIYSYKDWTSPEHRRRYLSYQRGKLLQEVNVVPEQSAATMVGFREVDNFPSRFNANIEAHQELIGYSAYCEIFGKQFPFNCRTPKRLGFELIRTEIAA